ncbi:MAG: hypothetical protein O7E52_06260 [Candidatus Poribacteria bacterium]|nr:hypothetical protein [Candidatus Poribacteria bacterium]
MPEASLTPQPFLDWYGIWPGQAGRDEHGRSWLEDAPRGVRLTVQPARKSAVFFRRERPWEQSNLNHMFVIFEDGRYRMWYAAYASSDPSEHFACYAESADGFHWERPELGIYEFQGSTANNILFSHSHFGLQSVFRDATAAPSERYKAIAAQAQFYRRGVPVANTRQTKLEIRGMRRTMELEGYTPEQIDAEAEIRQVVRGAVSPDGLRWTVLEAPLLDVGKTQLDTQNIAGYDPESREYVAYLRGHVERRRAVRRTGGPTFGNWSQPRMVLLADPQDAPDKDIYTSAYCRCPGSGRHLMFPSIFHRLSAELDIQLATSRDGWNWSRPERAPIVTRDTEDGVYSCIYASPNLVPLSDEEWGLPYLGNYDRHDWGGWPEIKPDGEYRWAIWKRGRLVALEAPIEGQFTMVERICQGDRLLLNYRTEPGGWIQVALALPPSTPPAPVKELEGYGLTDCDILEGDELERAVTWRGNASLSALKGRRISVRIRMARAKLFSMAL